jgi:hypothetical protein
MQQPVRKPRTPKDPSAWIRLAQQAADQARRVGDKREHSIRQALGQGQAEKLLRTLGIICEADILREFPAPRT